MKATAEGPQVFEWRFKNKRGKLQLVEVGMTRTSIGGKDCILANVRDISARKRARGGIEALGGQIPQPGGTDPGNCLHHGNGQPYGLLGFISVRKSRISWASRPEEWLADPEIYKNRIHPEDRDRVLTELLLSYSQGGPFTAEYRMLSKSGRVVWIRDESRAVFDSKGRPLFVQGVAHGYYQE